MSDAPPILITPQTVTCPGHGEHLRAQWPKGFATFSLTLIQTMFEDETFMRACGWAPGRQADVEKINGVLAVRPACYFVSRDVIRKALMESEIGRIAMCRLCAQSGIGGPYSVDDMGRLTELEHVCFECALDTGERVHTAHPKGGVWSNPRE